ncbi:hypothetical protein L4D76_16540 [Photobacterium sagamiensis]|uniref:hypothetical protein n=1 Tax=Photobacterium sagamiensis TaxID=2910241 RepID=UPI003D1526C7
MRRIFKLMISVAASLMAPVVFSNPTFESKGDGWTLSAGLYLITQNIEADSTVNTPDGGSSTLPVSLDFGNIMDNQDGLGAVFFRYGNGTWGVELDYAFISLKNRPNQTIGPITIDKITFDVEELEIYGTYRLQHTDFTTEFLAGLRYINHELDIDQTIQTPQPVPTSQSISASFGDDWTDPFFGVRLINNIADTNWFYLTRFDIGGFGVGSDLTWRFDLGGGYAWDNGWQAVAKYKRLDIDFDNDSSSDRYAYDGYEHGILLGAAYSF